MLFHVYSLYNKLNDKFYIGVSNNLKNRFATHIRIANGGKEDISGIIYNK